jgi:light-regulated signal transduction histidine kinase (bacteriophytochrome)
LAADHQLVEDDETPIPVPTTPEQACDREPIHLVGAIQPHGLMLIADPQSGLVIAGAGDIEGRLAESWLGRPLSEVIAQRIDQALVQVRANGGSMPLSAVPGRREAFEASLLMTDDRWVVELEPRPDIPASSATMLARLDTIGNVFERAGDLATLCERAAVAFRELTGFERVMIYRFLDDDAGRVIAEDRDPVLGSFLHHHFPASDIPRQARALYVRNRVRVIPQVDYTPAPIRSHDIKADAIDLSDSALRSVSPIHLQYLKNMGVAASASVSIVKDGVLWGLVACHNSRPRRMSQEARAACRALAGGLSRQIRAKEESALLQERIQLRSREESLVAGVGSMPLASFMGEAADRLKAFVDATGFAVQTEHGFTTSGLCPDAEQLAELGRWLGKRDTAEPVVTSALGSVHPPAMAYREAASGMMAVGHQRDGVGLMIWFRAEEPQTVEWAGNPHKAAVGPSGELTPRASFDAWREEVRGQARRWSVAEVEGASHLRRALLEVHQTQKLRVLNTLLSSTVAEKDALLGEKDHLLREVNHRVQNSLQLVQAFLNLQATASGDAALTEQLEEAQRRISAVALVHRRLHSGEQLDTVDLGRYLEELLDEMRTALGSEWQQRMSLDLAPMLISADRAIHIGLVLTELIINSNKYAYDGRPGPIDVCLDQHGGMFRLTVSDQGKGDSSTREGFGTRMMKAMVQRLGGTIERIDNRPGLRVVVSAPIDRR